MTKPDYFDIAAERVGDNLVVRLCGEFDPVSADALRGCIVHQFSDGARNIVVDCSATTFMDSSGLQVLLEAREQAHAKGGATTVRRPSSAVRRVIEATGLDAVLVVTDPPE